MNTSPQNGDRPTVVLVHGAFADASGWNDVIERLQANGVRCIAPPNPLRGIPIDSAYIASLLEQVPGPVLAVGHSYGGAVLTNAATNANNVVGLVYVAAFAPDEGERLVEIESGSRDSVLTTVLMRISPISSASVVETVMPSARSSWVARRRIRTLYFPVCSSSSVFMQGPGF